jgi:Dual specificity phosphatase, catalytic domain
VGAWEAADALVAAREPGWAIICVLENPRSEDRRPETIWRPVLVPGTGGLLTTLIATRESLEAVSVEIDRGFEQGRNVLVHCGAGIERSPLAVSWWLRTRVGLSLDEAYARLQRRRAGGVSDCRAWMALDCLAA